jgi:hypothetical protein
MQCNEVIRELAAPSDDQDSAALAEHLAGCAACSEWAKRASQLDRLWEVTRPADPTPQAWEAVWTRIVASLESSTSIRVEHSTARTASRNGSTPQAAPTTAQPFSSSRRRPWSLAAVASFGLAQAAAVLFVVGLAWHSFPLSRNAQIVQRPDPTPSTETSPSLDATSLSIEIEEGNLVVIRSEGQQPEVLVLTSESSPFGIDDWLLMFNAVESMAPNPVVAMKE